MIDRVHLLAHGNPLLPDVGRFGFASVEEYIEFARAHVPRPLRLTCDMRIMRAVEEPWRGGRTDDALRIRDVNAALGDPRTLALVALSGGAYFSRILPHLHFEVLRGRRAPLWALGFSEMTTLLGHVSTYRCGRALYWLCPNWLGARIKPQSAAREALGEFWRTLPEVVGAAGARGGGGARRVEQEDAERQRERDGTWRREEGDDAELAPSLGSELAPRLRPELAPRLRSGFCSEPIVGEVVSGRVKSGSVRIVGGCLAVLAAVVGGPLGRRLRPAGKWLMIEDIKESPYRIDRHLAALKLAGWFEAAAGVLVGDFRMLHEDTQPAVLELLKYHLPRGRRVPVVATRSVGHVWPMAPVLLNRPVPLRVAGRKVSIRGAGWASVGADPQSRT
ncbi:MAG: LD-carboxypeptidase [Planctomycetota bacterium]